MMVDMVNMVADDPVPMRTCPGQTPGQSHQVRADEQRYLDKCRLHAAATAREMAEAGFERIPGIYVRALIEQQQDETYAWEEIANGWARTLNTTRGSIINRLRGLPDQF